MPIKPPKISKQRIEKQTSKELARLMFNQQLEEDKKYRLGEQDRLFTQALKNIKEHCYHHCMSCGKYVEFPQDSHREENIQNMFFWIGQCPECKTWNYQNIFTKKYKGDDGETGFLVDTRWYTEEEFKKRLHKE